MRWGGPGGTGWGGEAGAEEGHRAGGVSDAKTQMQ